MGHRCPCPAGSAPPYQPAPGVHVNRRCTATSLDAGLTWLVTRGQNRRADKEPTMTTTEQRPRPATERLATLLQIAREQDEPDLDYPELVALLEAEAQRQQQRRRRRSA